MDTNTRITHCKVPRQSVKQVESNRIEVRMINSRASHCESVRNRVPVCRSRSRHHFTTVLKQDLVKATKMPNNQKYFCEQTMFYWNDPRTRSASLPKNSSLDLIKPCVCSTEQTHCLSCLGVLGLSGAGG